MSPLRKRRQGGFTLVEIVVAVTLLALLTSMLFTYFEPWVRYKAKLDTERELAAIAQALEAAYRDNAFGIDNIVGAVVQLPSGNIDAAARATDTTFAALLNYSTISPAEMARDGYGKPYTVFVSRRLMRQVAGTSLYYHVVAIVSSGMREGAAQSTFDPATGTLTLDAVETGVVVDGFRIQREHYLLTLAKIKTLAGAYTTYFQSRYLNDTSRSIGVNYFANRDPGGNVSGTWDRGGAVLNSATVANPATVTAVNLAAVLGVSTNDVTTGYGRPIYIDNASDAVRNPNNTAASMRAAPYTARLWAELPGGQTLTVSAMGTY